MLFLNNTLPPFEPYTMYHWIPMILAAVLGYIVITYSNRYLNERQKTGIGTLLALIPFSCIMFRMTYLLKVGSFDLKEDLPFYLCRFMALILPYVFYKRNRFWLGILYFWILVGTINANLTPDLLFAFPHFEYFVYWIYHASLMVCIFYAIFVYRLSVGWKDYWNAVIATILFTIFSAFANKIFSANYNYLSAKPEVDSLLDFLGPWPWYILSVYTLMFALFFVVLIPFLKRKKRH